MATDASFEVKGMHTDPPPRLRSLFSLFNRFDNRD